MKKVLLLVCMTALILHTHAQNSWSQKSNFSGSARYGAVSFSIGDKAHLGTGNDGTSFTSDFWEYDPATDTWTQKADFAGGPRYVAVGFSIGGKGYVGTGYDPSQDRTSDF